jgi:hypothetical protein
VVVTKSRSASRAEVQNCYHKDISSVAVFEIRIWPRGVATEIRPNTQSKIQGDSKLRAGLTKSDGEQIGGAEDQHGRHWVQVISSDGEVLKGEDWHPFHAGASVWGDDSTPYCEGRLFQQVNDHFKLWFSIYSAETRRKVLVD